MKTLFILLAGCLFFAASALAADGLVRVQSVDNVEAAGERLQQALQKKSMHLFARIDHQAGAAKVGLELRPTKLFIFGNPKAGTPLMQCAQTMAIDLPQKMLIYEDEQGKTWVVYNDPAFLVDRHGLAGCGAKVVAKITKVLAQLSQAAAGK